MTEQQAGPSIDSASPVTMNAEPSGSVARVESEQPMGGPAGELVAWAQGARQAHQIARSLAPTPFVPDSFRPTEAEIRQRELTVEQVADITAANVTGAILSGVELGLKPMASLRSMDIIKGTPALRAHAMRGLVQSHGHDVELVESTPERCVMRGRRYMGRYMYGSPVAWGEWQTVEWTIERARKLGVVSRNAEWGKQPQTMLVARATAELCRLVAADVLHAMPYAAEEIDGTIGRPVRSEEMGGPPPVTRAELQGRSMHASKPSPESDREASNDVPKVEDAQVRDRNERPSEAQARMMTTRQNAALFARLGDLGYAREERRADRLALLSGILDRPVNSTKDLSEDEAKIILEFLDTLPAGEEGTLVASDVIRQVREQDGASDG